MKPKQKRITASKQTEKSNIDMKLKGDVGPNLSNIIPPISAKSEQPTLPKNQNAEIITPRMWLGRFFIKYAWTTMYCVVEETMTKLTII